MFGRTKNTLFCFSPPVMLATFLVETAALIYTVVRYKMTTLTRIVAATLALLAVFQLAEYYVCGGTGLSATTWSRIGFMAITLLPALGIHMVQTISGRNIRWAVWVSYTAAIAFVVIIGFSKNSFTSHICAGNYAIFQLSEHLGGAYFTYYYFLLFAVIGLGLWFSINASQRIREALILQVLGYLTFVLPTGVVNAVNPNTVSGIPSVMCGFAVLYALVLVFGIVPSVVKAKKDS